MGQGNENEVTYINCVELKSQEDVFLFLHFSLHNL